MMGKLKVGDIVLIEACLEGWVGIDDCLFGQVGEVCYENDSDKYPLIVKCTGSWEGRLIQDGYHPDELYRLGSV